MKNQPDLSTLTVEELEKRAKTTKTSTGLLLGIIIVQFILGIFLTFKQGFNVFTVIPLAFLPIVFVNYTSLKKIKEEIANRNS
jgi:hypothetical protein